MTSPTPSTTWWALRFVADELDPFCKRNIFLDAARRVNVDIFVVFGNNVSPKSKAEMIALHDLRVIA